MINDGVGEVRDSEGEGLEGMKMIDDIGDINDIDCWLTGDKGMQTVEEVRVVDPKTGGEKGEKPDRYDLIPPEFEKALAFHYGVGCRKYSDRNWEKGYYWHLSYRALRSHLNAWQRGKSIDPETGSHHLIAVAWHAICLYIFELRGLGTDDVRTNK